MALLPDGGVVIGEEGFVLTPDGRLYVPQGSLPNSAAGGGGATPVPPLSPEEAQEMWASAKATAAGTTADSGTGTGTSIASSTPTGQGQAQATGDAGAGADALSPGSAGPTGTPPLTTATPDGGFGEGTTGVPGPGDSAGTATPPSTAGQPSDMGTPGSAGGSASGPLQSTPDAGAVSAGDPTTSQTTTTDPTGQVPSTTDGDSDTLDAIYVPVEVVSDTPASCTWVGQRMASVVQRYGHMYYHFVADTVPRLALLKDHLDADTKASVGCLMFDYDNTSQPSVALCDPHLCNTDASGR